MEGLWFAFMRLALFHELFLPQMHTWIIDDVTDDVPHRCQLRCERIFQPSV